MGQYMKGLGSTDCSSWFPEYSWIIRDDDDGREEERLDSELVGDKENVFKFGAGQEVSKVCLPRTGTNLGNFVLRSLWMSLEVAIQPLELLWMNVVMDG